MGRSERAKSVVKKQRYRHIAYNPYMSNIRVVLNELKEDERLVEVIRVTDYEWVAVLEDNPNE